MRIASESYERAREELPGPLLAHHCEFCAAASGKRPELRGPTPSWDLEGGVGAVVSAAAEPVDGGSFCDFCSAE